MSARRRLVIKIGSSSVTAADGTPDQALLIRLAGEINAALSEGWDVVVVSSGAVLAGWSVLGQGQERPSDLGTLQAVSAVGQHRLMAMWADAFARCGRTVGQVLLARLGEADREQYEHAQQTFAHLFSFGVVPIVNENDAVADDEIRFGDNDRLAALVAHLIGADRFVMLTDTPGLLTGDPRVDDDASLIEEVTEIDRSLELLAGGPGAGATGGMASKLTAARIATWSGIETFIADARQSDVLRLLDDPANGVGTRFRARASRLSAHKLWIAFALGTTGQVTIDDGAKTALVTQGASLLAVGVQAISAGVSEGDAVEVLALDGQIVAKGIMRLSGEDFLQWKKESADPFDGVVIHRDDLVVFARADQSDS